MKKTMAAVLALLGALWCAKMARAQQQVTFKIATLAPEGSSWMRLFHEWAQKIETDTNGHVKVKFYSGGVQGDERDVVRKIRLGQLNGAGVTGVGLSLIAPEVRVLELPFLLRTEAEIDYIRDALADDLQKKFNEKGYVMVSLG